MPLPRIHTDESGQTMTEYALLVSLVAILMVAVFPGIVTSLQAFFTSTAAAF